MFLFSFFKTAILHARPETHPTGAKGSFAYCGLQMYPSLNKTVGTRHGFFLELIFNIQLIFAEWTRENSWIQEASAEFGE